MLDQQYAKYRAQHQAQFFERNGLYAGVTRQAEVIPKSPASLKKLVST